VAFHEDLRNYRLKKGLILEEISEDTKINIRILQALEQGDYHILPVPYVRLFMKAYAQSIDYPVEDILRGLENELKLTGEQGALNQIQSDSVASMDMTGATFSGAQNLFQGEKTTQSNIPRLLGGIVILVVVIIFGKSLLKPETPRNLVSQGHLLPSMNISQTLESVSISDSALAAHSDSLTITSVDFLSIIRQDGLTNVDTIYQEPGKNYSLILSDSTQLKLYPGDAALISISQDTIPGSPFSNSWLVISTDSKGSRLNTYPTL